jgi:hypothetical protein
VYNPDNHDDRDRYNNQQRDQQRDSRVGKHSSPSFATVKPERIPFANQALLGRVPSFPVAPSQFFRCFNHKIRRQMYLDQSSRLIIIIRLLWHHYLYQYRLVVYCHYIPDAILAAPKTLLRFRADMQALSLV